MRQIFGDCLPKTAAIVSTILRSPQSRQGVPRRNWLAHEWSMPGWARRKGAVDVVVVVTDTLCVVPADVAAGPAHTSRNRQTPRPAYRFLWMCQARLHRKHGMTRTTYNRTMSLEGTAPHSPIEGNPRRCRAALMAAPSPSSRRIPTGAPEHPGYDLRQKDWRTKTLAPPETTCGRHRSSHWNQNKTPTTRRDSDSNEAPRS